MREVPEKKGTPSSGGATAEGAAGIPPSLLEWRERTLRYVLWIATGIGVVALLFALNHTAYLPLKFRLFGVGIFLLTLLLALFPSVPYPVRTWSFLLGGLALAGIMFIATGLMGGGRVFLLAVPLYGVVFLGPRAGWVTAAAALILYAGSACLRAQGWFSPPIESPISENAGNWLLQGVFLLVVLGPVMLLLNRFVGLLGGALVAERLAAERIEAEAHERSRLERTLLETVERERRVVGHQLHDGPCQQITAALLRCKVARNALDAKRAEEGVSHLNAISELLSDSVGEIHDLARGLSPPELSPDALSEALENLARGIRRAGTVDCGFHVSGGPYRENPEVSRQILRIAQEAVNNSLRHSQAHRVDIELQCGAEELRLLVRDDGVGPGEPGEGHGMGTRIMRHRAEIMGGNLSVGHAPGGGTLVICKLPVIAQETEGTP